MIYGQEQSQHMLAAIETASKKLRDTEGRESMFLRIITPRSCLLYKNYIVFADKERYCVQQGDTSIESNESVAVQKYMESAKQ